jgi:hypothetical protein
MALGQKTNTILINMRRRKMPGPPMALVWATSVFTVFVGHQPLLNMNLRATTAYQCQIPAFSATSGISLRDRLW